MSNIKIQGEPWPSLPSPSDAHACGMGDLSGNVTCSADHSTQKQTKKVKKEFEFAVILFMKIALLRSEN